MGLAPQTTDPAAGMARGGQARVPGLSPASTRRTMPTARCAAPELASLLDRSSAGELIPELARQGLQKLIELELAAFLGADLHERTHRGATRPPQRLQAPHPDHPPGWSGSGDLLASGWSSLTLMQGSPKRSAGSCREASGSARVHHRTRSKVRCSPAPAAGEEAEATGKQAADQRDLPSACSGRGGYETGFSAPGCGECL